MGPGAGDKTTSKVATLVLSKIPALLTIYIDCKMALFMLLQGRYIRLQSKCLALRGDPIVVEQQKEALRQQLTEHRQLMRTTGVALRDLGSAALLGYATLFVGHLVFSLSDILTMGYLTRIYQSDNFISTYRNPKLADEKLDAAFNGYLRRLISLNTMKLRTLMNTSHQIGSLSRNGYQQIIADLNGQQMQLRRLLQDKTPIWPQNRQEDWLKERSNFAKALYIVSQISLYPFVVLIVFAAAHFANQLLEEKDETPMNPAERFSIAEHYYALYVGIERSIPPMVLLIINLRDKTKLLQLMQLRFKRLSAKLIELKQHRDNRLHWHHAAASPSSLLPHHRVNSSKLDASNQNSPLPNLKVDCNREALEIYLSLRVFIDDLKPTTNVASLLVNQCCTEIGFISCVALMFSNNTEFYQLVIIAAIAAFLLTTVNMVFLICATFGATCVKTTQLAWSLVANITDDMFNEPAELTTPTSVKPWKADEFRSRSLGGSLINMDTANLWRRFVEDLPTLHQKFRCTVFGMIPLNYREMLNLNFWFISVVLIFLTQKWDRH